MMRANLQLFAVKSRGERDRFITKLSERIRTRFHVSCAAVDGEDEGDDTAAVGCAVVGDDKAFCERVLDDIVTFIEADGAVVVGDMQVETYDM